MSNLPNPRTAPPSTLTTLLWMALVVSIVGNSVASIGGAGLGIHLVLGAVTVVCIGLLVARRFGRS